MREYRRALHALMPAGWHASALATGAGCSLSRRVFTVPAAVSGLMTRENKKGYGSAFLEREVRLFFAKRSLQH